MQINWKQAESREIPQEIDKTSAKDGVYIRQNIVEDVRLDNDGNEFVMYCYDEAFLTNADYEQYTTAQFITNSIELKHESDIIDAYTLQLIEEGVL